MKLVKAYNGDGSYSVLFEDEQGNLSYESDGGYGLTRDSVIKTEPLEQGDTLQELIDWCKENDMDWSLGRGDSSSDILNNIRTPKLDKITLEEANEILKEQGKIIEL